MRGTVDEFLTSSEIDAIDLIREQFSVDVTRTYQFWEAAIARITTGSLTDHKCPWDIELPFVDGDIRIEVKFSQEFNCEFSEGARPIFKFAVPKGSHTEKPAHVVILIGIDAYGGIYCWVVPAGEIGKCASITLTSPRVRQARNRSRSFVNQYMCPLTQILPEVLRAYRCHLAYDGEHHAETRAKTYEARRLASGVAPLFPREGITE